MEPSKKHWLKFYPADWRADPKLRACSLAARGLLIELMGLMHEADPYGHLLINGEAPTEKEMARYLGVGLKGYLAALQELTSSNTLSVTAEGVFVSRRMVRDHEKSLQDKENGRKGAAKSKALGVDPPPPALDTICQRLETREEKPPTPSSGGRPARSGKSSRLPADFILTDARRSAALRENVPADRVADQFDRFFQHYSNAPAKRIDWDVAWIQWCAEDVRRLAARQQTRKTVTQPCWHDTPDGDRKFGVPKYIHDGWTDAGQPKWIENAGYTEGRA